MSFGPASCTRKSLVSLATSKLGNLLNLPAYAPNVSEPKMSDGSSDIPPYRAERMHCKQTCLHKCRRGCHDRAATSNDDKDVNIMMSQVLARLHKPMKAGDTLVRPCRSSRPATVCTISFAAPESP